MALFVAVAWVAPGAHARAQLPLGDPPPVAAVASGRVVTPGPEREIGLAGVMVTVHRVGPDSAGVLDSARSDATGRYTIRYRRFGSDDAVYFAAALHHGIAYFSSPLRGVRANANDAEITVFDTTSAPVAFTVQGHHVVVSAPTPDGGRDIVEVYELSNDTTVTVVGRDSLAPVWSAPIPRAATAFVPGQGDVSPVTLERRGDRVTLAAAFGPGVKQLSYSYTLPPSAFPLQLTLERPTSVLEVLLEEPAAQVRASTLRSTGDATTQGRTFKRFVAQGAPRGEVVRIDVPVTSAGTRIGVLIALALVIALAMAVALWRALSRRGRRTAATVVAAPTSVDSLVAAIAALDARHEAGDATLPGARYADERAALKAQLTAALAAESGTP
ncbi:MAG TPA: hypothetical protein VM033_05945 [Gemmatimonadaceae bacterium]|nr:hypothetical protein [Gemmatimonadaceae bacterium]